MKILAKKPTTTAAILRRRIALALDDALISTQPTPTVRPHQLFKLNTHVAASMDELVELIARTVELPIVLPVEIPVAFRGPHEDNVPF